MAENRTNLYNILGDLWGSTDKLAADNVRALNELTKELESSSELDPTLMDPMLAFQQQMKAAMAAQNAAPETTAAAPEAAPMPEPEAEPEKPAEPAKPSFQTFWKLADEQVDWTDALAYAQPQDATISAEKWQFFHEQADAILKGDVSAYLAVLKFANPLKDLCPFARALNVHAESADRMTVSFESVDACMQENQLDAKTYLSGVSLRCARDLMALLPVREIAVTGVAAGQCTLQVTFQRNALQKVRFGFVDPVALVTECGGCFTEEDT